MRPSNRQRAAWLALLHSLLCLLLLRAWSLATIQQARAQSPEPVPVEWFGDRGADRYENNYAPEHAPLIAIGEALGGLNCACPRGVSPDCNDQDWYALQLKGGLCYVAETHDLHAGLDTNLIAYRAELSATQPLTTLVLLAGNDDAAPGRLESRAAWCLPTEPASALGYILVGNHGLPPEPRRDRTYTLLVRVVPPALLTPAPSVTATPRPTRSPAPHAPTALAQEPVQTQTPSQGPATAPATPQEPNTTKTMATLGQSTPMVTRTPRSRVTILDQPAATLPPATPIRRIPLSISVQLIAVKRVSPKATPAPGDGAPIAGVRVQLVNAFDDLLAEGVTPASGELTLRREALPGSALLLRIPAFGMRIPVRADQPGYLVAIPAGGAQ